MRFRATEDSLLAGEYSLLAIAETLGAMALALWIGLSWSNYMHIAIGASIAPLLLLRTDESCGYGMSIFNRLLDWYGKMLKSGKVTHPILTVTVYHLAFPIGLILVRVLSSMLGVIRHFSASLCAIPMNWHETVFLLDSGVAPCLIPEPKNRIARAYFRRANSAGRLDDWASHRRKDRRKRSPPNSLSNRVFHHYLGVLAILSEIVVRSTPYLYRWSLKSTAVVWFPLLWWSHAFREDDTPLKARLEYQLGSDLFWMIRIASILAILGFATKLALYAWLSGFAEWWNSNGFLQSVSIVVQPTVIPRWQIVIVVNALIAIGLWIYIRDRVWRLTCGIDVSESKVRRLMSWTLFARRLLTS